MRCDELPLLIDLYLDDELDRLDHAEIDGHVDECDACAALVARQAKLKAGLRGLSGVHQLDGAFQNRLHAALMRAPCPSQDIAKPTWHRVVLAASVLVAVPATAFLVVTQVAPPSSAPVLAEAAVSEEVVDESVRWHSRPLPVEVTGPEPQTVSDWFRGKLDFPVAPPNFSRRAHLLGGRLGNLRQSEAALLVYDVHGSKLSVMIYDAEDTSGHVVPVDARGDTPQQPLYVGQRNGYNVAVHQRDGVGYTFTSDLSDRELVDLVNVAFSY